MYEDSVSTPKKRPTPLFLILSFLLWIAILAFLASVGILFASLAITLSPILFTAAAFTAIATAAIGLLSFGMAVGVGCYKYYKQKNAAKYNLNEEENDNLIEHDSHNNDNSDDNNKTDHNNKLVNDESGSDDFDDKNDVNFDIEKTNQNTLTDGNRNYYKNSSSSDFFQPNHNKETVNEKTVRTGNGDYYNEKGFYWLEVENGKVINCKGFRPSHHTIKINDTEAQSLINEFNTAYKEFHEKNNFKLNN